MYKSERLGLEEGIIFQETDQLVEDLSLDKGKWELPLKNKIKNQMSKFKFMQLCLQDTLGWGRFGKFSLVQGSKLHLN